MNFKQLSGFVAGPGGFLLLIFFFLPWISVSCSGNNLIEASGLDLATGIDEGDVQINFEDLGFDESLFEDFESGYGDLEVTPEDSYGYGDDYGALQDDGYGTFDFTASESGEGFLEDADPKLYIIPIIGLLVLGWAIMGFVEEKLLNTVTGVALYMVPALIGGIIMVLKFVEIEGNRSDLNAEAAAQGGFNIVSLNYETGWWMTILSLLAIFAAGAVIFLGEGDSSPKPAKVDKTSTGTLAALKARQQQADFEALSVDEMKARFAQAKEHIQAKRYDEARAILRKIDHPTAAEWLQKLDELDPFGDPFA